MIINGGFLDELTLCAIQLKQLNIRMYFNFQPDVPQDYDSHKIRLISGEDSLQFSNIEFLICRDKMGIHYVFQINFEYSCSPFKEALIIDNLIAVGHERNFYLYNLAKNAILTNLEVEGYFGHLYYHDPNFYVADASGINCIDNSGNIIWANNSLAIDGVIIQKFENNRIYGAGEWDPPGGWRNFVLNKNNGQVYS